MRSYIFILFTILSLCTVFVRCVPESGKVLTEVTLTHGTLTFQEVINHQAASDIDSLVRLLDSNDPTIRYLAARSFASIPAPSALAKLHSMLDDPVIKVRSMVAYALGQQGNSESEQALIAGFRQRDTMSVDNAANGAVLTALGKISNQNIASFIASAEGYREQDTLLIEGQMKSLYQFGLRGISDPDIIQRAVDAVRNPTYTDLARLYAAHFLARTQNLNIDKVKFQIAEAFVDESDSYIKMALATALKNTSDSEILTTLLSQMSLEQDYRVKCNILASLSSYEHELVLPTILEALRSDNIHIARKAADYVATNGTPADAYKYRDVAKDSIPTPIKTAIYESVFKLLPHYYEKTKNATRWQVQQALASETNLYGKIGYLKALGYDPSNSKYLLSYADTTTNVIVKTAALEALGTILSHKDFNAIHQTLARSTRRKILAFIQEQMALNDEGLTGVGADIIANPESQLKPLIDSTNFLKDALAGLKAPQQLESIHAVEKALAHVRGVNKPILTQATTFKPINWNKMQEVTDKTKAIVKTTRGLFTISFYPSESPESVQNFISLAENDYFDNMLFHRVVPNFVIQTGSPRGDNYGGADYVIHSELGPRCYDEEGYVGMASAGPNTESTQWFVTHSPTPHLNGRYSIFGKVTEGMDVVHNIQVGDKITDIIISHLK